jgi:hypothetical protein
MLKWLGGIANACVLAVLTTAAVAIFQAPLSSWLQSDLLNARVDFAPWVDPPEGQPRLKNPILDQADDSPRTRVLKKAVRALSNINKVSFDQNPYRASQNFGLARILIENNTHQVAKNIIVKFTRIYLSEKAYVIADRKYTNIYDGVSKIELPDMRPGDTTTVFLWYDYGYYPSLFEKYFTTNSSLGRMTVKYYTPATLDSDKSSFDDFVDNWGGWIMFGLLAFGWLATGFMAAIYGTYFRALLKDEALYQSEKVRWDADPKKFQPNVPRS